MRDQQLSRRRLLENIVSLYLVQGANYLLPLITFPYLVRVLGTEKYGLLVFSAAFVQYFVVVTDYGFNLTATRLISLARDDPALVSRLYSCVTIVKLGLMALCTLTAITIILAVPRFREHWEVYALSFQMVLGAVLFPLWLFQGLEQMKFISIAQLAARAVSVLAILLFVREEGDYLLAAAFQAGGALLAGVIGLVAAWSFVPKLRIVLPSSAEVWDMLRDGREVFVSQVCGTLFANTNVFLLGVFHGNLGAGRFAVAEKIVRVFISLQIPVCSAIYPRTSALFARSKPQALRMLRKVVLLFGIPIGILCLSLFVFADAAVRLIVGEGSPDMALLVRIMAFLPLSIFIDNIFGTQILLNVGGKREFTRAAVIAGIVSLFVSFLVVPTFGEVGTAWVFLIGELLLLALFVIAVRDAGVRLFGRRMS
jgi:PST family polysaccharide transporter